MTRRASDVLFALLLSAAVAAVYAPAIDAPLVFDDLTALRDNPFLRRLWPPGEAFRAPERTTLSGRPVTAWTFALNRALCGPSPTGYRLANVFIHAGAALLLYGLVRRTLVAPRLAGRFGGASDSLARLAAALWALHPLQTESVTYVVQRVESLSGFFYLLALYAAARAAARARPGGWGALAVAAVWTAMGAKEIAASAPVVLLVYDRTFWAGSFREAVRRRGALHAAAAAAWIPFAWILASASQLEMSRAMWDAVSPWEYAATQGGVILRYLRLVLWPAGLCLDYAWPIAASAREWAATALAAAAGAFAVLWALRRRPAAGFLGLFFLAVLAPTSSVFPLADAAFEHRMYLPLAVAAVAGVALAGSAGRFGRARVACAAAALLCLAAGTARRNMDYRDPAALWRDVVTKRPANPRARNNLGDVAFQRGDTARALAQFGRAAALAPRYADAHFNRALAFERQGDLAAAAVAYARALAADPRHAPTLVNLGALRLKEGRAGEAVALLTEAVSAAPLRADAHGNLACAFIVQGRLEEAHRHLARAIALKPDFADAWANRGAAYGLQGNVSEAVFCLRRALAIDPRHAGAHYAAGSLLAREGHRAEAAAHFRAALAADPDHAAARAALAEVMGGE